MARGRAVRVLQKEKHTQDKADHPRYGSLGLSIRCLTSTDGGQVEKRGQKAIFDEFHGSRLSCVAATQVRWTHVQMTIDIS